jgi:hypothetical protein
LGAGIAGLILQEQLQVLQRELQQGQVQQLALLLQQVPLFLQVLLLLRLYYSQTIKPSQPSLSL